VRTLNFAIELRSAALDVRMSNAEIFNMPMEFGLELVAIICAHFSNAERELFNDVVNEVYSVCLGVFSVDFEGLTRVASSIAVYWNLRIFCPIFPLKVKNLTST